MIILDVNKLGKNFGYGQLFENVSFSLNEGESISIVGPNGCGKSTLLKIIAGIEKADSGQVSIKYFINKFADKIIEFKEGHITTYLGNYDDYREKLLIFSIIFDTILIIRRALKFYKRAVPKQYKILLTQK